MCEVDVACKSDSESGLDDAVERIHVRFLLSQPDIHITLVLRVAP